MKKVYNYKIINDKKLIIIYLHDDINADVVINFINVLVADPNYRPDYYTLVDLRDTRFKYKIEDIKRTLVYMETLKGFPSRRKTVYITSNSKQVVPPMLLKKGQLPMEVQVTSTLGSAVKYLSYNENMLGEIENTLQELKAEKI
jgi:hypothetical protein